MKLFEKRPRAAAVQTAAAQTRSVGDHPFGILDGYAPLRNGEIRLYRAIREAVPIVDAAILKLIRLCGGLQVVCDRDVYKRQGLYEESIDETTLFAYNTEGYRRR